jgi:hypothetical protein
MPWTRSGTVSVAQNSTTVTGTGTDFAADSRVGDAFIGPDGRQYEISNAASATVISILPAYAGPTLAAGNYAIVPIQGYNKDTADALRQASLEVGDALDGMAESVQSSAESATAAAAARDATIAYRDAAALSASAADDSEAQALSYRDAAQGSASTASTQASNAASARTAAEAARDAALGYRDNASASATAAAASAAAANGVGPAYLQGLLPVWNSGTSISLGTGMAYIPGLGKSVSVTSVLTLSGLSLVADTWYWLYLYDNAGTPAIELVTTTPTVPYSGTARTKTGDTSRRFVFAVRTIGTSLAPFKVGADGFCQYLGNCDLSPYVIANTTGTTAFTALGVRGLVPISTNVLGIMLQAAGTSYQFAATGGSGGRFIVANPNSRVATRMLCNDAGQIDTQSSIAGQVYTAAINGYGMDR